MWLALLYTRQCISVHYAGTKIGFAPTLHRILNLVSGWREVIIEYLGSPGYPISTFDDSKSFHSLVLNHLTMVRDHEARVHISELFICS